MGARKNPTPRKPRPPKPPPKGPGGPRTKRRPETALLICEMIEAGAPRRVAADSCGISERTFYEWMAEDAQFLQQIHNAEHSLHRKAATTLVSALDPKHEMSHRLNAAKYLLSNRWPNEWSTRTEVRQTGHDGGAVKVEATVKPPPLISDAALLEMTPEQVAAAIGAVLKP